MLRVMYIEVAAIGIVMLLVIRFYMRRKGYDKSIDKRTFKWLIDANILILVLDALSWPIDMWDVPYADEIYMISMALYYCAMPLPSLFWLLYTDSKVHMNEEGLRKRAIFYVIPVIGCIIVAAASVKTGWVFYFVDGVYHRGPFIYGYMSFTFAYLLVAFFMAYFERDHEDTDVNRRVCNYLMFFPFPTILATIIQTANYGIELIWITMAVSLFVIFLYVQNEELYTDALTGLYNRRYLDSIVERVLNETHNIPEKRKKYFAIIIDLDDFKKVNDTYGHIKGDEVLSKFGRLLLSACGDKDMVARMGGDEFFIIGQRETPGGPKLLKEKIETVIREYNAQADESSRIYMSMGITKLKEHIERPDQLISAADANMYREKAKRKKNV